MRKLSGFLRRYWGLAALALVCMLCEVTMEMMLPTLMADIVNNGMLTGNMAVIYRYGLIMAGVAVLNVFFTVGGNFMAALMAVGVGRDLRRAVFERCESHTLSEHGRFGAASLITRATNDVLQVQQALLMCFRFVVFAPLMCVFGFIMAYTKNRELTFIFAVSIPAVVGVIAVIGRQMVPLFRVMQKKIDRVNLVAREGLTGVRVIRAFNRQEYERGRFDEASAELMKNAVTVNRLTAFLLPAIFLTMNLTTAAIIWFGGIRVSGGYADLGGLLAFPQYAMMIMFSFVMLSMLFVMFPRAQAAAERIAEVVYGEGGAAEMERGAERTGGAAGAAACAGQDAEAAFTGLVEFRGVTFRYEGAERAALSNISFTARPGQTTAVIGGTGAGKSTLLSLIPRFYEATGGEVLIDGKNVLELELGGLRSIIGYVPQKAELFSETVAANIRFGNENATEEDIIRAAETAQAAGFIESAGGYEHMISQGGANVSGGQRQRLSIARALVRSPLIYLFDDSFSALDMKTDAALRRALKERTKEATVIIVAQRVSSIIDADNIIVLDGGEVIGAGTHEQLLKNCAVYEEIAKSQMGGAAGTP